QVQRDGVRLELRRIRLHRHVELLVSGLHHPALKVSTPRGERPTPHSLRHCFASTALAAGIPITDVSRWLGHKTIEITHLIYGHLLPATFDRALDVLDMAYRPDPPVLPD
ncbi:tyrosine-type recombinase/integrase, partial [Streptosporangiaceae bacterium NEAU-GS5]|nr:tyrosine-type recombinase/integrase [Streptosporangiaceae bacterium NEAU-GS5]